MVHPSQGVGCRVEGSGLEGLGFRVEGFRVQGFRVQGFKVQGLGLREKSRYLERASQAVKLIWGLHRISHTIFGAVVRPGHPKPQTVSPACLLRV